MNTYASDHEQWELIKVWWKANGKMVIAVVLIAMLSTYGFRYWQQRQQQQAEQAAVLYQQLQLTQLRGSKQAYALIAEGLEKDYPKTPYASLAAMSEAKAAVENNDLTLAEKKLTWAMEHANSKSLAQIARLRTARVLLAEAKPDAALQVLDKLDDQGFMAAVDQIKGDIYLAKGEKAKAKASYQAALTSLPPTQAMRELISRQEQQLP